jgi:hypothetical protein
MKKTMPSQNHESQIHKNLHPKFIKILKEAKVTPSNDDHVANASHMPVSGNKRKSDGITMIDFPQKGKKH